MDYISLFITEKGLPIAFLLLDKVVVSMGGESAA